MILISLHVPETYLLALENMVKHNLFPNRAEGIRAAIRDFIQNEISMAKSLLKPEPFIDLNTVHYEDSDGIMVTRTIVRRLD